MNTLPLTVVVVATMLVSCTQQTHWIKTGAGQTEFNRDFYRCEREALVAYPHRVYPQHTYMPAFGVLVDTKGLADIRNRENMRDHCLRANGWSPFTK